MVIVTQADRDAAVRIFKRMRQRGMVYAENMTQGYVDDDFMIQAFAKHRLATIEECAKVAESDLFAHEECDVAECIAEEIRALKGGNDD